MKANLLIGTEVPTGRTLVTHRFRLQFSGNPSSGSRIIVELKKNGSNVLTIDKTFNTFYDISNTTLGATANDTVLGLVNNLTDFNPVSIVTYSVSTTPGGSGFNDVWIDVNGVLGDTFTTNLITSNPVITVYTGVDIANYPEVDFGYDSLDLFNDENISITQNVNNFKDISKVIADYSQTFTIPCSPRNNSILSHWYDTVLQGSFDSRYRYKAVIKLDGNVFIKGDVQLSSAKVTNGMPESYSVTFFGKVKQIKDILGELKLKDLNYSDVSISYPLAVESIIESGTLLNVMFPLLAHNRRYTYGDASGTDVTTVSGGIDRTSLFPAVRVNYILGLIENKLGLTLTPDFNTLGLFDKLYLLYKNSNVMTSKTERLKINFTSKSSANFLGLNLTNDKLNCGYFSDWIASNGTTYQGKITSISMVVTPTGTTPYRLIAYKNGEQVYVSDTSTGVTGFNLSAIRTLSGAGAFTDTAEFYIESDTTLTFTTKLNVNYHTQFWNGMGYTTYSGFFNSTSASQTTVSSIGMANYAPDMKIYDFIMGLVKCFNLVVLPTNQENNFRLIPLDDWYSQGAEKDFTKYLVTDLSIEQPKIYKKLNFTHAESSSVTNYGFEQAFSRKYGDLSYTTNFDTTNDEYSISSPFEDILYERLTGSDFQTATFVDKTGNTYYTPKPMLMFCNGLQTLGTAIKLKDESGGSVNITSYNRFSNDIIASNGASYSLNWGNEFSSWNTSEIPKSLFSQGYENLITGLFDIDSRILKGKLVLPLSDLLQLKLNDRLYLRGKVYVINNITTNLLNNECDVELITDFRSYEIQGQTTIRPSNTSTTIFIPLYNYATIDVLDSLGFLSGSYLTSTGNTTGISLDINPTENTGLSSRVDDIPLLYKDSNGNEYRKFITVVQESYFVSDMYASIESVTVDNSLQTINITVFIGENLEMNINVSPSASTWISNPSINISKQNETFTVTIQANTTGLTRTGAIIIDYTSANGTVYLRTIEITQNA